MPRAAPVGVLPGPEMVAASDMAGDRAMTKDTPSSARPSPSPRPLLGGVGPEGWVAALLLVVLVVMMSAQVFLRFVFGMAVSWLEEVIRFVFVWSVYASFLVAAADDRHIRVALHLSVLPRRMQKAVLAVADLLWIGFNLVLIYASIKYCLSLIDFPYRMPTTRINLLWVFIVVPLGFLLLSIRIGINIGRRNREEIEAHDTPEGHVAGEEIDQ